MTNVNIKEVEGGEVSTLNDTDGMEIDSGTTSYWIQIVNLVQQILKRINGLTAKTSVTGADEFALADSAASYAAKKITWTNLLLQAFSSPTIVTPTIASFANANHNHADVAGGGSAVVSPYKFSVTVSADDLVVAIKHLDDTDPSSSRPLYFKIGSSIRSIVAATSITIVDGTNWFNSGSAELGTLLVPYFIYVVWDSNSSVVALSIARIPYGRLVSDFSATTTNEKHLYNYANFTSTDDVANIGYFEATLSLSGTSHLWTVPTFTNDNLRHEPTFNSSWMSWTAAITGFSANPTFLTYYQIINKNVFWVVHATAAGTSNATTSTLTLPWMAANVTNLNNWTVGRGQDNGAEVSNTFRIVYNTNVLDAFKGPGNTAWTNSGTKYFSGQGFYRVV